MMTPSLLIVPLLLLLLAHISWGTTTNDPSLSDVFVQCLHNDSTLSFPISSLIYTPSTPSYATVLQSYIRNLRFNESTTPKPALIITPLHVTHIQSAIKCAKMHNLQMKIRSGGHDFEGISYWSDEPFFILDMYNMRFVNVSIDTETAWVQAGATLGEVYHKIAEKSYVHGYPAGVCFSVGVGGHLSGAGYGNMMRKYGLSIDNVVDAEIIDVNGRVLNRVSMGEDLFWAITGGGGASYGVVLAYKINLVRVPKQVTVYRVNRTLEQNATDTVYRWQQVADKLHEDIFIRLIIDVVNGSISGEKTIRATFHSLFLGESERLLSLMEQNLPELGLTKADCQEMSWVESVIYWTNFPMGTPVDALLSRTPNYILAHYKRKSDYLKRPIPKSGLEFIWKKMIELQVPILIFNPYGGKMAEISPSAKPFPHRAGNIAKIQYATNWIEDGTEAANHYINLTRKLYSYMTPFVSKSRDAFLNYRDLDLGINHNGLESYAEGTAYGIKYFKGNYKRLVQIKTKVDPDNFFRNEQSIPVLPSHWN